jgi:thiamine biosynthesis lipoprotein
MKELDAILSFHDPKSDLSKLNRSAGGPGVVLLPETLEMLEQAGRYARLSDGAFNVMVGPLVKRWKVTSNAPDVPSPAEIRPLLRLADWRDCRIDSERRTAGLAHKGQMVDLGGIAKGYASDEVIAVYRRHAITSAIVDIGGNIGLTGPRPDGSPWRIGIQDPWGERGSYIGYLQLTGRSVSTSGDYERFFERGGKRYSHIIDPRTGYPAESGLASVTIVADSAVESDALSTAVFVLGADRGIALVKSLSGTQALCITGDRKILATGGLRGIFVLTAPAGAYTVIFK